MTPTIGRVVHYRLSAEDVEQIMRRRTTGDSIRVRLHDAGEPRWPAGAQAHIGNPVSAGQTFPMMIVAVGAGPSVNGQVFLDGTDVLWVMDVTEGDDLGKWRWPERV